MKFLALFLVGLSTPAFAVFETRNGGFVVTCPHQNGTSSEVLLDLAVRKPSTGWLYQNQQQFSLKTYVHAVFEQVRPFDPSFADFLQTAAHNAINNIGFVNALSSGQKLPESSLWDGKRVERTDCYSLTQAAFQNPSWMSYLSLTVVKPVWSKLDLTNRAALIVHEVIYGFLLKQDLNIAASSETRALVRSLFTPGEWSQNMTQQEYDRNVGQRYQTELASFLSN